MRLWSIHPQYLDAKGLVALWREGLLAQKVLTGKTKGYRNHPQLLRFKSTPSPLKFIGTYLSYVCDEAKKRGYSFDESKIIKKLPSRSKTKMSVTLGQLDFELVHLKKKLKNRSPDDYKTTIQVTKARPHPLFRKKSGDVESWETV